MQTPECVRVQVQNNKLPSPLDMESGGEDERKQTMTDLQLTVAEHKERSPKGQPLMQCTGDSLNTQRTHKKPYYKVHREKHVNISKFSEVNTICTNTANNKEHMHG